jgi:hypothetical protein
MIVCSAELGTKNLCAGEDQQQFSNQSVTQSVSQSVMDLQETATRNDFIGEGQQQFNRQTEFGLLCETSKQAKNVSVHQDGARHSTGISKILETKASIAEI